MTHQRPKDSNSEYTIRLMLGRGWWDVPWRIRRPSGIGVPDFNFKLAQFFAQLLAQLLAPCPFFQVFEVLGPLQKSSPAPADPTSPPPKATTEIFASKKRLPMTFFFGFLTLLVRFCPPRKCQNRTKIGPKSSNNPSNSSQRPDFEPFWYRFRADLSVFFIFSKFSGRFSGGKFQAGVRFPIVVVVVVMSIINI